MANRVAYAIDTSTGGMGQVSEADTLLNVATVERTTSGAVSLYEDNNVTSITLGGGSNYTGALIGKAGVADKIRGALNVGTVAGATATGDFTAGLGSAGRMAFDQGTTTLAVYNASSVQNVMLDAANAEIKAGWVTDAGSKLGAGGVTGNAASTSDTAGQAVTLTAGAGNGTGAGGAASLIAGAAGATGTGGAITITSGAGGGTSGDSGDVTIDAGSVNSGTQGTIYIGGTNADKVEVGRANQTTEVMGNLTVSGTTTTVSTTNLSVADDLIILRGDSSAVPADEAGIAFERGTTSSDDAIILWNEVNTRFELGLFATVNGTSTPTGTLTTFSNLKLNDLLLDGTAITADGALTITATGADLSLTSTTASVNITGPEAAANAIHLNASNAAGGIDIDAGTAGIAVDTTGPLSLDSTGTAANLTLNPSTGTPVMTLACTTPGAGYPEFYITSGGQLELNAEYVHIQPTGGGTDSRFHMSGTSGEDLSIATTATTSGSLILQGAGSNSQSIWIKSTSSSGSAGVDFDITGGLGLDVDAANGPIDLDSADGSNPAAIRLNASGTGGGVDIDADTGGIAIDTTGGISIDAATASNLTVSGATADLTLGARSATITLNQSGDTTLSGFTKTSIVGALNEALTEAIQDQSQMAFGVFEIVTSSGVDADSEYNASDFQVYDAMTSTVASGRVNVYYETRLDTRQTTISNIKVPIKGTSGSEILIDVRMDGATGSNQYTGTYGTKQTAPTSRSLVTIDGTTDLTTDTPTGEKRIVVKVEAYIDAGETLYIGRPFLKAT